MSKQLHMVTYTLMVVGALNWGLMGLLDMNLVNMLLGAWPMLEKVVYILVGVSALVEVVYHKTICKYCSGDMK